MTFNLSNLLLASFSPLMIYTLYACVAILCYSQIIAVYLNTSFYNCLKQIEICLCYVLVFVLA